MKALVLGAGPGYKKFIASELLKQRRVYGCGCVTNEIDVDVYAYGDESHSIHLPKNPNCVIWVTQGIAIEDAKNIVDMTYTSRMYPRGITHGASSGGMAITIAAMHHPVIELAGFDVISYNNKPYDPNSTPKMRKVLEYWKSHGRVFVDLDEDGIFADMCGLGKCELY